MIDNKKRYVIKNYGKKSTFSNFLPGISGEMGIPLWCFYVNRGQAVASFGILDKDHSIMQFYPAHQSYQNTKRCGFRTFVKTDGIVLEPFQNEDIEHSMAIGMNELEITETNEERGLRTEVLYYTLPNEMTDGLVRKVTLTNLSKSKRRFEAADGMAVILPYGINLATMTDMGQTAKAWMQVLQHETGVPIFKVRASMEDSAQVTKVNGGNYGFAMNEKGEKLKVIVSTEFLFGYDTSLQKPVAFMEADLKELMKNIQNTQNEVPCCFFTEQFDLNPMESHTWYEVYGQAEKPEILETLVKNIEGEAYFIKKYDQAVGLTTKITDRIDTHTGDEIFDLYCRQTFLDNVLRGGEPVVLGGNKVFYRYSRKHGDIERDYNYFKVLPEFYSQGNGNFRDVNQNRRNDVRFYPYVGEENIRLFYNAIQLDGYNPLGIEKMTYRLTRDKAAEYEPLKEFLNNAFTPGELMKELISKKQEEHFQKIMRDSTSESRTEFHEGYWSDHWTYNLDLVEEYLAVYPDKEKELLLLDRSYNSKQSKRWILPAAKRYVETEKGIRQYNFHIDNPDYDSEKQVTDITGKLILMTLMEKMILLSIVKTAALDVRGMGIEMEGGKPGWYDALNGLPGILGSSMAETYELGRMLEFMLDVLERHEAVIFLPIELETLLEKLLAAAKEQEHESFRLRSKALMDYRSCLEQKLSGQQKQYTSAKMHQKLQSLLVYVNSGIKKAMQEELKEGNGICPTYFYYEVTEYRKTEEGIDILCAVQKKVPYFLEGSVRYLKRKLPMSEKLRLYEAIRSSSLFDEKLAMYKVNAGLNDATYELGRARAFTPGWLENESVWLHMEYKYLLELLKSELLDQFLEDFHLMAIPFQKEERYGRSVLENSSFLASCANPDPKVHGKGFVARLSGSTAEFLHMWQIMMFGRKPFTMQEQELCLQFSPILPKYLIGDDKMIMAKFMGTTKVFYSLPDKEMINDRNSYAAAYDITMRDNTKAHIEGAAVKGEIAAKIRAGEASQIHVRLKRRES